MNHKSLTFDVQLDSSTVLLRNVFNSEDQQSR